MGEQFFGTAPCGCSRDPSGAFVCQQHRCPSTPRDVPCGFCDYPAPWNAAEALEQGLRAIRSWPWHYTIEGQWFGKAPCGCARSAIVIGRELAGSQPHSCPEHRRAWFDAGVAPWKAAEALQKGLRAIAGWPLCDICLGTGRQYAGTNVCPRCDADWPGALWNVARRLDGIQEELGKMATKVQASRTTCYYCGGPVPCSDHTQP